MAAQFTGAAQAAQLALIDGAPSAVWAAANGSVVEGCPIESDVEQAGILDA